MRMRSKYGNRKVIQNGIEFDSVKEARRYGELLLLQRAGEITDLELQVKFVLIPAQYEPDRTGKNGKTIKGKLIERECAYVADFVYKENGFTVVEDTKGVRTKEYIIKRKLMLWEFGIRVKEV